MPSLLLLFANRFALSRNLVSHFIQTNALGRRGHLPLASLAAAASLLLLSTGCRDALIAKPIEDGRPAPSLLDGSLAAEPSSLGSGIRETFASRTFDDGSASDGDAAIDDGDSHGERTLTPINNSIATNVDATRLTNHRLGVVGRRERVAFPPHPQVYECRVDSGAKTSSLDARNITPFERDGEDWVRFYLHGRDGQPIRQFERPVERKIRIKTHGDNKDVRFVVEMDVALGDTVLQREFSLVGRQNFDYSVLIGRNVLDSIALIDVSRFNLLPPPVIDASADRVGDGGDSRSIKSAEEVVQPEAAQSSATDDA